MARTDVGTGAAGEQPAVTADNFIRVESDAVFYSRWRGAAMNSSAWLPAANTLHSREDHSCRLVRFREKWEMAGAEADDARIDLGIPEVPPEKLAQPTGHHIRDGHRVIAAPILAGLHHEYRLEPLAA